MRTEMTAGAIQPHEPLATLQSSGYAFAPDAIAEVRNHGPGDSQVVLVEGRLPETAVLPALLAMQDRQIRQCKLDEPARITRLRRQQHASRKVVEAFLASPIRTSLAVRRAHESGSGSAYEVSADNIEALSKHLDAPEVQATLPTAARGSSGVAVQLFRAALSDLAEDLATVCKQPPRP